MTAWHDIRGTAKAGQGGLGGDLLDTGGRPFFFGTVGPVRRVPPELSRRGDARRGVQGGRAQRGAPGPACAGGDRPAGPAEAPGRGHGKGGNAER